MSGDYLIDGCNVVRTRYGFRPDNYVRDDQNSIRFLKSALGAMIKFGKALRLSVVFDGSRRFKGLPELSRMDVRFGIWRSADDIIVELVRLRVNNGYATTVVTADRGLIKRVLTAGGMIMEPRIFWASIA